VADADPRIARRRGGSRGFDDDEYLHSRIEQLNPLRVQYTKRIWTQTENERMSKLLKMMVARNGVESPTPACFKAVIASFASSWQRFDWGS
jgi:hypothetical protein